MYKSEIILSSDYNYDNLVAEIYINGKYIALVGYNNKEFFVETATSNGSDESVNRMPYDLFTDLLEQAKEKLTAQ